MLNKSVDLSSTWPFYYRKLQEEASYTLVSAKGKYISRKHEGETAAIIVFNVSLFVNVKIAYVAEYRTQCISNFQHKYQ